MYNSERAVLSFAVFVLAPFVVAMLAVVEGAASANKEGFRATEHALPGDEIFTVSLAMRHADTKRGQLARPAEEVVLRFAIHEIHLLFAINQATKVGL